MHQGGKLFIYIGIIFLIIGVLFILLEKIGLGKLPGDIYIHKGNFHIYFPIMSCILLSIVLTFILSLLCKK